MPKPSPLVPPLKKPASTSLLDRRAFLVGAGVAGVACGAAIDVAYTQIVTAADHSLRIAPLKLELAPGKVIETFGYNGGVPGPVLHLREGRQVSIDIHNDTDIDDIIHWHGLYVPSAADGAMEEGSPMVGPRHRALYVRAETHRHALVPQPRRCRAMTPATAHHRYFSGLSRNTFLLALASLFADISTEVLSPICRFS